jgi:hypothetical protein
VRSSVAEVAGAEARNSEKGPFGRISIDKVWELLPILLPSIASLLGGLLMIDLAFHVRAGETMLQTGSVLRTDTFSFVGAGDPWLNQQWLGQVMLALAYRAGGWATLVFVRCVILGVIGGLLYSACRAVGAEARTAGLLSIGGLTVAFPTLGVRPQIFGALFFAITLWVIATHDAHPRRLWFLLPLAIVWANVHGSFFLLPLVLCLAWVDDLRTPTTGNHLLAFAGATTVLTLVNPFGVDTWRYVLDLTTNPVIRNWVSEWAPPTIRDPAGVLFFISVAIVFVVLVRQVNTVRWTHLLWLGVFFGLGLLAIRSLVMWAFVAPIIVARSIKARPAERSRGAPILNAVLLFVIVGAGLLLLPWWRPTSLMEAPSELVVAVRSATSPGARIIVPQTSASWFELTLPDRPVFVDSRIELYSARVWGEYRAFVAGRSDWAGIVDRWRAEAIVTKPAWPVVPFLRQNTTWRLTFENEDGLVFVRT